MTTLCLRAPKLCVMRPASHSLHQLGRYREALGEALAGFEVAYSVAEGPSIASTAPAALHAGIFYPLPQAVSAFARWVTWDLGKPRDERANRWEIWLGELVSGLAEHYRDPGLLRDVAGLLTAHISPQASTSASLLIALAQVDEADDPQAVLARTDPDSALWLRRIRDLPEAPARPPRRRK